MSNGMGVGDYGQVVVWVLWVKKEVSCPLLFIQLFMIFKISDSFSENQI
jgi:hypothetical protein